MKESIEKKDLSSEIELSDEDIFEAMKDIQGYLDVTPADLKEIYKFAYRHALKRIASSIKARDIMTIPVFSVKRATSIKEVAELMADKGISGLPVLEEDGKVAGVISEKDFFERMGARDKTRFMSVVAEFLEGKGCVTMPIRFHKAEDIMTAPAVTVREETTVSEISGIFFEKKINRVPVTDIEGRLMGIVCRSDIVRSTLILSKNVL